MEIKADNINHQHKVGDLVYSNSYGLGWIESIAIAKDTHQVMFSRFAEGTIVYRVNFEYSEFDSIYSGAGRDYDVRGIDTMKMFLRIKMRGENV